MCVRCLHFNLDNNDSFVSKRKEMSVSLHSYQDPGKKRQ